MWQEWKTPRVWRALVVCLTVVVLASCASRPEERADVRVWTPMEAVPLAVNAETATPAQSTARPLDRQTILAISGGGADGAFGAGVLVGWTQAGTRPKFDVVTGVSTGALMAVLAFLGPQYDSLLEQLYTTQSNDKIYRDKGITGFFSDSLYDYEPLKKQIQKVITAALLDQVAAEYDKGRKLYIATTNLDAGELVVWDMGRIAKGGRTNRVLHFQKVLRASAAVPAFFPPVYIKPRRGVQIRQAHVDGGVRAPVLVRSFMFKTPVKKRDLYVIVNSQMSRFNAYAPVKPDVGDISRKAITELLRELLYETVYRSYVTARNAKARFHLLPIPDTVAPTKDALKFDRARMRLLFETGRNLALRGDAVWLSEPPRLHSLERVAVRRR